ncbi:MAG: HEAT repeat domain-containing protein [Chloroflexi bacterium]|nr:HEAT repeat domain-containing protein [Chloroflexota bacterium]
MNWLTGGAQGEAKRLIAQLSDSTRRDSVARDLIKLGTDAVPSLIDALQTQDLNLLPIYEQILARIPSSSLPLTKALASPNPTIRARVAETLGINEDKSALPMLVNCLKDEYYIVREAAAKALGNIGEPRVIPALLPILKDKDLEVRSAACIAIGKFKDPSTFDELANILLDDPKIEVRQSAATALGETKHIAAIPFLMEALHDSFWWYERDQAAMELLTSIGKMGTAVVEPLIEALGHREGSVRRLAATALGDLGDSRAIEELGMTLYDLHHEVGKAAAQALAKFGAQAVHMLVESLGHAEAGIRGNAIIALGTIQDMRVAPALIEMLHDPDRANQKQALQSLGQLRDQRVQPVLQEIAANRGDKELAMMAKQILERNSRPGL